MSDSVKIRGKADSIITYDAFTLETMGVPADCGIANPNRCHFGEEVLKVDAEQSSSLCKATDISYE